MERGLKVLNVLAKSFPEQSFFSLNHPEIKAYKCFTQAENYKNTNLDKLSKSYADIQKNPDTEANVLYFFNFKKHSENQTNQLTNIKNSQDSIWKDFYDNFYDNEDLKILLNLKAHEFYFDIFAPEFVMGGGKLVWYWDNKLPIDAINVYKADALKHDYSKLNSMADEFCDKVSSLIESKAYEGYTDSLE